MKQSFYVLALAAGFLIPGIAQAGPVENAIFNYECAHADAEKDGFTCSFDKHIAIHITTDWSKESKEKADYHKYQLNKFIYRIYELGGTSYTITSVAWPAGAAKNCTVRARGGFFLSCQKVAHQ